jgi:hypothetical protein
MENKIRFDNHPATGRYHFAESACALVAPPKLLGKLSQLNRQVAIVDPGRTRMYGYALINQELVMTAQSITPTPRGPHA